MNNIEWTDEFSVGVQKLDKQHQKIIALINDLSDAQNSPEKLDEVHDILFGMMEYSQYHLKYEETLLKKNDYPDFDSHQQYHLDYIRAFSNFSTDIIAGRTANVTTELLDYLNDWWKHHILEEDMKYKTFFKEKGIS